MSSARTTAIGPCRARSSRTVRLATGRPHSSGAHNADRMCSRLVRTAGRGASPCLYHPTPISTTRERAGSGRRISEPVPDLELTDNLRDPLGGHIFDDDPLAGPNDLDLGTVSSGPRQSPVQVSEQDC